MNISYKNICKIAFPVLVSLLVEQLIGITDTAFLGHVGEVELGASAIAGVFYLIFFVIGSGFGVGLQVLIARLNGEKEYPKLTDIFTTGLSFMVLLAVIMILLSKLVSPAVLHAIIKSDDIYSAATRYLDWRIFGLVFSFIITAFRAYYVGITRTKILSMCSLLMVVVNIVCNYILVFGKFGAPALGIEGAAIGSCIAEMSAAMIYLFHYAAKEKVSSFSPFKDIRRRWNDLKRIMRLSVWTMLQSFFSLSSWLVFFVLIEHLGEKQLAISNIVRSISSIPFMFTLSLSQTASSLVGNLIGEGRGSEVMRVCRKVIALCYVFSLILIVLGAVFPQTIIRLYTEDATLIQDTVLPFWVMLSAYIITVPSSVIYSAISGTGNAITAFKIEILGLIVYVVYIVLLDLYYPNVALLWTSEHIYYLTMLIPSFLYLRHGRWKQKKI